MPLHYLQLFTSCKIIYKGSLVLPQYKCLLLFYICFLKHIHIRHTIALARTSRVMLYKSGETRHLYVSSELRRKIFFVSPLHITLNRGFWQMLFIRVKKLPSISSVLRIFIMIGKGILSNDFSSSIEIIFFSVHYYGELY